MTETQKRIKAYQKALPSMKERVMAVALLLVISISMMTSATFAWITLSRAPEVTGMATSFAANGNLEIALSDTDGLQPEETAVGDGNLDNLLLSNLTWGNLINLSDTRYGLDSLVLRPATLNTRDLINSPMSAVEYGADGRVIRYITDFAFSNYKEVAGQYTFAVPDTTEYGVRAVSSVTYEDITGNAFLVDKLDLINRTFTEAQGQFTGIYMSDSYMNTIGYLVGVHVSYILGDDPDVLVQKNEVENLVKISTDLYSTMEKIGTIITELINLHQYLNVTDAANYHPYTFEELFKVDYTEGATFTNSNMNNTVLNSYVANVPSITTFKNAWKNVVNAHNGILDANANSEVYWKEHLMTPANLLCDMNDATLNDKTPADLQANMINEALDILGRDATDHVAVINSGALKDADQLIDGNLLVTAGRVSITVVVPESIKEKLEDKLGGGLGGIAGAFVPDVLTLKPEIKTGANPPAMLDTDYKTANQRASGGTNLKGQPIAADTYAMAVDFWLRTNADDSLLILEGELETKEIPLTDGNGDPILDEQGNQMYETVVLGYQGVNRVWDELDDENSEESLIIPEDGISGTQGSGSCYVFYSTDPEQQSQTKNMLRAMRVAFVNSAGDLMVEAYMDVDHALEESGRVTVPLVLFEQTTAIETDDGQSVTRYIQAMPQNIAQRITAIIYLDGEILTNSEVLDAGSIKGQLNIQFGTTKMELDPMEDNDVMASYYTLDFYHNGSALTEGQVIDLGAYDPATANVTLKLNVDGSEPSSVKGNFLSIINSTQGAKQREFVMTKGADGYWTADIPFSGPGDFELRSLQIDGVDVSLDASDIVCVNIDGIALQSLYCFNWPTTEDAQGNQVQALRRSVMTAESYYQQEITVGLASAELHSVRGIFIGDNGKNVSVNFTNQDGSLYRGKANFNASGTYELTYLEIDGTVTPLEEAMCRTITLQLGLRAYVTIGEPVPADGSIDENALKDVKYDPATGWSFIYTCEEPLTMPVSFMIFDDQNKKIENLSNVKLVYGVPGSDGILLDTDANPPEWNVMQGTYDGAFLFQSSGVFAFRHVIITQENQVQYVTVATGAPTITSIPPTPMEYVAQPAYDELTYALGASRDLSITLKNAPAATLDVVLTNGDGERELIKFDDNKITRSTPEGSDITTFTIKVPSDGQWTITEAYVSTVFYKENEEDDGKFYSGSVEYDADGAITKDDRLNISDLVVADDIGSYFLTAISVTGEKEPSSQTKTFMSGYEVADMTIAVTANIYGQEKAVAAILSELAAKFPGENINDHVSVKLTYDFQKHAYYTFDATAAGVPESTIVRTPTRTNNAGAFVLDTMTFMLAGTYTPELEVTIGETTFTGDSTQLTIDSKLTASGGMFALTWTLPEVQFTQTDPAVNQTFAIRGANDTYLANGGKNTITNENHSLTAYFVCTRTGEGTDCDPYLYSYVPSTATAQLTNAGSAFASATLTIDGTNSDMVYNFSPAATTQTVAVGSTRNSSYTRQAIGDVTASTIVMAYNNVSYTVNLANALNVTNTY